MTSTRTDEIHSRLTAALAPEHIEIVDESHLHVGHAGARDGHGHFRVTIVAKHFVGMPMIRRHREVYSAVGDLMQTDIHALTIIASAPGE